MQANYDQKDSLAKKFQEKCEEFEQSEYKTKQLLNNLQADYNDLQDK